MENNENVIEPTVHYNVEGVTYSSAEEAREGIINPYGTVTVITTHNGETNMVEVPASDI